MASRLRPTSCTSSDDVARPSRTAVEGCWIPTSDGSVRSSRASSAGPREAALGDDPRELAALLGQRRELVRGQRRLAPRGPSRRRCAAAPRAPRSRLACRPPGGDSSVKIRRFATSRTAPARKRSAGERRRPGGRRGRAPREVPARALIDFPYTAANAGQQLGARRARARRSRGRPRRAGPDRATGATGKRADSLEIAAVRPLVVDVHGARDPAP